LHDNTASGEFSSVRGGHNWMAARESAWMAGPLVADE